VSRWMLGRSPFDETKCSSARDEKSLPQKARIAKFIIKFRLKFGIKKNVAKGSNLKQDYAVFFY
jgi:hypothetical protein